jgi:hypothetical protein
MSPELCLPRTQASRRCTTNGAPTPLAPSDDDPADPEGSLPLLDDALPDGGEDASVEELLPAEVLDAGGDQGDEEEPREEEALLGELPPLDDEGQDEPEPEHLPPLLLPPLDDEGPSAHDDAPPPPLLGFEEEDGEEDGEEDENPSVPGDLIH